jgi:hypothetical protein
MQLLDMLDVVENLVVEMVTLQCITASNQTRSGRDIRSPPAATNVLESRHLDLRMRFASPKTNGGARLGIA